MYRFYKWKYFSVCMLCVEGLGIIKKISQKRRMPENENKISNLDLILNGF